MQNDYSKYTAQQLLEDDLFLQFLLKPTSDNTEYWNSQCKLYPHLKEEIDIATSLINNIKTHESHIEDLTPSEFIEMWQHIQDDNKKLNFRKKERLFWKIASAAAVFAIIIGSTIFMVNHRNTINDKDYLSLLDNMSMDSQDSTVQLILSNQESITLDGDSSTVQYAMNGVINVNSQKVATDEESNEEEKYNQLIVPAGKRSTIVFSDGSKIWVNSGTKLIYPVTFKKDKREIYLDGEVYLEVTHNEKWPFNVHTGKMDIAVLGTSFNVNAYKTDATTSVVLVNGKVEVTLPNTKPVIMKPSQRLKIENTTDKVNLSTVDVDDYIAWKDGYYQFEQKPLLEVTQMLGRYYAKKIVCDQECTSILCNGKLDLKDDIKDILFNLTKAAPVNIVYEDDTIFIKINK